MSYQTWSFYDEDGTFLDVTYSADDGGRALELATPEGATAIEGTYDRNTQRMDVATGKVIEAQSTPPTPEHEWDAMLKRWTLPAAALARRVAMADADQEAIELQRAAVLPLIELALDSNNAEARAHLTRIRDRLRAHPGGADTPQ